MSYVKLYYYSLLFKMLLFSLCFEFSMSYPLASWMLSMNNKSQRYIFQNAQNMLPQKSHLIFKNESACKEDKIEK